MKQNEKSEIVALEKVTPCTWIGQLSEKHRAELPADFEEITQIDSIEDTWKKVIHILANSDTERRTYDLVEPFYGKDPSITKSKKPQALA